MFQETTQVQTNSREPESEEKPQKSLNEKQQVSAFEHELCKFYF